MGAIFTFLKGFSIKQYLYAGIAILALTFAMKAFGWVTGYIAEKDNLKTAVAELTIQKAAFEIQHKSDEAQIAVQARAMELQQEALVLVQTNFSEIREIRDQQHRVLEGSRLARLAAERAQRIEELSNRATQERNKDFEAVINEDF